MLGKLNQEQIESLLKKQVTGRIACVEGIIPYIVPINYVYDGEQILSHSAPGKKIAMMRRNPRVCFQVDDIQTIFNWQSVIAWGRFEEIVRMEEKERAMVALKERIMSLAKNRENHPSHGLTEKEQDVGTKLELIFYKIVLIHKTGRFERS